MRNVPLQFTSFLVGFVGDGGFEDGSDGHDGLEIRRVSSDRRQRRCRDGREKEIEKEETRRTNLSSKNQHLVRHSRLLEEDGIENLVEDLDDLELCSSPGGEKELMT